MPIGGGGRTPDDFPGDRIEDAILIISGVLAPVSIGEITYVSGVGFEFFQEDGIALLRSGNINATDHENLRQLVHLAEGGGPWLGFGNPINDAGPMPFPSASIWWTDSSRTKKIVQKTITRNANKSPSVILWQAFAADGVTIAETMTDRILYNGAFEVSRSRS